jgi:hypothetical protein
MEALWRDPDALGAGQLWRLLSPVLVQSDDSALVVIAVFALCAVIGVLGEGVFSPRRWIALYLLGALVGHGIGEVFQPEGGGTSVAFMGILGGLAAYALRPGAPVPRPVRAEALIAIPLAILDTALRDIHGLPFLAGLLVGWAWLRRDYPRPDGDGARPLHARPAAARPSGAERGGPAIRSRRPRLRGR